MLIILLGDCHVTELEAFKKDILNQNVWNSAKNKIHPKQISHIVSNFMVFFKYNNQNFLEQDYKFKSIWTLI